MERVSLYFPERVSKTKGLSVRQSFFYIIGNFCMGDAYGQHFDKLDVYGSSRFSNGNSPDAGIFFSNGKDK